MRAVAVCWSSVTLLGREHLRLPAFSLPTFFMPLLLLQRETFR